MTSSPGTVRLLGNIAVLLAIAAGAGYVIDGILPWFGIQPAVLCFLLSFTDRIALAAGMVMVVAGIFILALTGLKSDTGLGLVIGGFLLSALPQILASALGAVCIP